MVLSCTGINQSNFNKRKYLNLKLKSNYNSAENSNIIITEDLKNGSGEISLVDDNKESLNTNSTVNTNQKKSIESNGNDAINNSKVIELDNRITTFNSSTSISDSPQSTRTKKANNNHLVNTNPLKLKINPYTKPQNNNEDESSKKVNGIGVIIVGTFLTLILTTISLGFLLILLSELIISLIISFSGIALIFGAFGFLLGIFLVGLLTTFTILYLNRKTNYSKKKLRSQSTKGGFILVGTAIGLVLVFALLLLFIY